MYFSNLWIILYLSPINPLLRPEYSFTETTPCRAQGFISPPNTPLHPSQTLLSNIEYDSDLASSAAFPTPQISPLELNQFLSFSIRTKVTENYLATDLYRS